MPNSAIFAGRALCSVDRSNPEFTEGMRGAYIAIVCRAHDISSAVDCISKELAEHALTVRGFDYLFDIKYFDRKSSKYEDKLVHRLGIYPVQFEDVHYFKT